MTDQAVAETRGLSAVLARPLAALRFLVADRLGLVVLAWLVIAFVLRPLFLAAHAGGGGNIGAWLRGATDPMGFARNVAVIQWLSFALTILILAFVHIRLASTGALQGRGLFLIAAGYAAVFFAAYMIFLWEPASAFTLMLHDSFIFYDASYRIAQGQVPSADFPTALGALTLYLPALGASLGGHHAGSVEMGSAIFALMIGLATAQAGASRFPSMVTALLVATVFTIAVPAALLGASEPDSITVVNGKMEVVTDALTYGMFYNAWGWAALVPAFAWLAPRRGGSAPPVHEVAIFGLMLAAVFYLKISYFIPAIAAAAAYAFLNPRPLRILAIGGGVFLAAILAAGVWSGLLFAYVRDIMFSASISGDHSGFLLPVLRVNLQQILLALAPMGIIAAVGKLSWRDGVVAAVIVLGCLFAGIQNGRFSGLPPLAVLSAYAVARLSHSDNRIAKLAVFGAFVVIAIAPIAGRTFGLIDQAYAIRREELRNPAPWSAEPALKGVHIVERESMLDRIQSASDPEKHLQAFYLSTQFGRKQALREGEYMEVVMAGVNDLRAVMRPGESVVSLDMSNPFLFILGARPAKGSWLTMDNERTLSAKVHPAPEQIFADADHVMIPKISLVPSTTEMVRKIYGGWLGEHYAETIETPYWTRYSVRLEKTGENAPTQSAIGKPGKPPNTGL